MPFARHSPLPELRAFVSLFRPVRVVPNSLNPSLHGLDMLCIPHIFDNCLSSHPPHSLTSFAETLAEGDIEIGEDNGDATLQNLVGDGADAIVRAWTDSTRIVDKLTVMEPFLRGKARDVVRHTLGISPLPTENDDGNGGAISILQRMRDAQRVNACRAIEHESDLETQSEDEDAHARTAKLLFGVSGRSQMAGCQGRVGEQIQSSESHLSRRPLVEGGSGEDAPIPKTPHAMRASTQQASDCSFQMELGKGTSRGKADWDLASLLPQLLNSTGTKDMHLRDTNHKPSSSFSAVSHVPFLPSLTSPASNLPYASSRGDDPPLTDVRNIPRNGTGTKRRCIQPHSRSQSLSLSSSQSQFIPSFPSSAHLHFPDPAAKRRKVGKWLDVHCKLDAPTPVLVSEVFAQGLGLQMIQVGKSTDAAPQTGSTEEHGLDMDGESRRAQRRALRVRSRAIEERLRHALPMHAK